MNCEKNIYEYVWVSEKTSLATCVIEVTNLRDKIRKARVDLELVQNSCICRRIQKGPKRMLSNELEGN
jgi:ribosomal protein L10